MLPCPSCRVVETEHTLLGIDGVVACPSGMGFNRVGTPSDRCCKEKLFRVASSDVFLKEESGIEA